MWPRRPRPALGVRHLVLGLALALVGRRDAQAPGADRRLDGGVLGVGVRVVDAHVYSRVLGPWIEGEASSALRVRKELIQAVVDGQRPIIPGVVLLLGVLGVISGRAAISLALGLALADLGLGRSAWGRVQVNGDAEVGGAPSCRCDRQRGVTT